MIQAFYMDRCHFCPSPESSRVSCRSIQRKVKDFFSFFTCSMSDIAHPLDTFYGCQSPNAIWTSYKNGPFYHRMISLLLFSVTSKVLAGKALQRTPYPQPPRYRYRENDIYTHLLCPDHPAKLWISKPSWRTRQIEHLMISLLLSSRDPGGSQGSTERRETPQYPFRPWGEIYHSRDS
jgi:hypothetical protein